MVATRHFDRLSANGGGARVIPTVRAEPLPTERAEPLPPFGLSLSKPSLSLSKGPGHR